MKQSTKDVIIIGGGQSALAVGYYLRKTDLDYLILDQQAQAGGSWPHYWESLRLFSPAQWNSLPGILMQGGSDYYPSRDETIRYLQGYEERYHLPIERPVTVESVHQEEDLFVLTTSGGKYRSRVVISATGSFPKPYLPPFPGQASFRGTLLHSADYRTSEPFRGQAVVVVGEGNSGAQILAEVSQVADTTWVTLNEPEFLPDDISGRDLFDYASAAYQAHKNGEPYTPPSLGNIVMVPSVREARQSNVYQSVRPFAEFSRTGVRWSDGQEQAVDAVIFCTGFRPALDHLEPLGVVEPDGKVLTRGTRAEKIAGLWLVGYGSWTGFCLGHPHRGGAQR